MILVKILEIVKELVSKRTILLRNRKFCCI